ATLEEEYTLELRTGERERKLLKKVEKSLRMIDGGSYGYCEETGEPIGIPRLLARPTATLSLEAQERRERVQRLYGDYSWNRRLHQSAPRNKKQWPGKLPGHCFGAYAPQLGALEPEGAAVRPACRHKKQHRNRQ